MVSRLAAEVKILIKGTVLSFFRVLAALQCVILHLLDTCSSKMSGN